MAYLCKQSHVFTRPITRIFWRGGERGPVTLTRVWRYLALNYLISSNGHDTQTPCVQTMFVRHFISFYFIWWKPNIHTYGSEQKVESNRINYFDNQNSKQWSKKLNLEILVGNLIPSPVFVYSAFSFLTQL